jgi:hypothetical protein
MESWHFFQNGAGQWCWRHLCRGEVLRESERAFASRTDCIADAMHHGYLSRTGLHAATLPEHGFAVPWRTRRLYP